MSEGHLRAQLDGSIAARTSDKPKSPVAEPGIWIIPRRRVDHAERLAADLYVEAFPDPKVSEDRSIQVPESGTVDRIQAEVPELQRARLREATGSNRGAALGGVEPWLVAAITLDDFDGTKTIQGIAVSGGLQAGGISSKI